MYKRTQGPGGPQLRRQPGRRGLRGALALLALLLVAVVVPSAASAANPLTLTAQYPTNITSISATLKGTVNTEGYATWYTFLYGKDSNPEYEHESDTKVVEKGNGSVEASIPVGGLQPLTKYRFVLVGVNDFGIVYSEPLTFETPDLRPFAETRPAAYVREGGAVLRGLVNPRGFGTTYYFEYGANQGKLENKIPVTPESVGSKNEEISVKQQISGLSAGTTYYARLIATSSQGTRYGNSVSFEIHNPRIESSGSYPVTLTGQQASKAPLTFGLPSHPVEGAPAKVSCTGATVAGSLAAPSSSLEVVPSFSGCTAFGLPATITSNGCAFGLNAAEAESWSSVNGSLAVKCPAGKEIEIKTATCTVNIGAKTGLQSIRLDQTGTSPRKLEAVLNATGLKYTVVKDGIGCPLSKVGSSEDGTLTGATSVYDEWTIWDLQLTGEAAEVAHGPRFEAELYPATLSDEGKASTWSITLPSQLVEGAAAAVRCTTALSGGSLTAPSTATALSLGFSGCTAFGLNATVSANGCSLKVNAETGSGDSYGGKLDLVCPAGKVVEVRTTTCSVDLAAQTGLDKVSLSLASFGPAMPQAIALASAVNNLTYSVTKDGIGCPLSKLGTFSDGTVSGSSVIVGRDAGGKYLGVRVNSRS